MSTYLISYFTN